jgi:hypothetical protein
MRIISLIVIISSIQSCSELNDEDLDIDVSLFYGKWYTRERCTDQNYKVSKENGEFTHRFSLNKNCNIDTFDVKESYSSYVLSGNEISYGSSNIETIIEGTNDTSVTDEVNFEFYVERIIELTEEQMTIEIESKTSGVTNKKILYLYRSSN